MDASVPGRYLCTCEPPTKLSHNECKARKAQASRTIFVVSSINVYLLTLLLDVRQAPGEGQCWLSIPMMVVVTFPWLELVEETQQLTPKQFLPRTSCSVRSTTTLFVFQRFLGIFGL